jgi:hypothetical protein
VGKGLDSANPCHGTKQDLANIDCLSDAIKEQAGADVTVEGQGELLTNAVAITESYFSKNLCPVNVHWHLGAEHKSSIADVGYDETGASPGGRRLQINTTYHRSLATDVRYGGKCHYYNADDPTFTNEYDWKHCVDMHVGDTYEVHWPHSAAGDCGTPHQYQTPFYDGVFCHFLAANGDDNTVLNDLSQYVGVQAQVFTIVNDEDYFYPDLMRGMIIDGDYGKYMAYYTGSTTGTTRSNTMCSQYTPITWQVDRHCHLISASSFDKMCADMKMQRDDMSGDLHAHGAREVVTKSLTANNVEHIERSR